MPTQLVFDEPKAERPRRFVPVPSPVADTLKRHRPAQAAERLPAPVWAPLNEHLALVFATQIGSGTTHKTVRRIIEAHNVAHRIGHPVDEPQRVRAAAERHPPLCEETDGIQLQDG